MRSDFKNGFFGSFVLNLLLRLGCTSIYISAWCLSFLSGSLDPWIPAWVRCKTHLPIPPWGVLYLVGTVSVKEIDPWKNIPLRARRAPAVRENVLCSLHRQPQNDFLELRTIKIKLPSCQKKSIHEKISRFACAGRPQCAKTCYGHYIGSLKTDF